MLNAKNYHLIKKKPINWIIAMSIKDTKYGFKIMELSWIPELDIHLILDKVEKVLLELVPTNPSKKEKLLFQFLMNY